MGLGLVRPGGPNVEVAAQVSILKPGYCQAVSTGAHRKVPRLQVQIAGVRQVDGAGGEDGAEMLHGDMPPQQTGLAPVVLAGLHLVEVHTLGDSGPAPP